MVASLLLGSILLSTALPGPARDAADPPVVELIDPTGTPRLVLLDPRPLRSPHLVVRVWRGEALETIEPEPSRVFRGRLARDAGSSVFLLNRPDGEEVARVFPSQGRPWSVGTLDELPAAFACGTCADPEHYGACADPPVQGTTGGSPLQEPVAYTGCVTRCEVAFDADHAYFQHLGGTTAAVVDRIEWMMAVIDHAYVRDALITYDLTEIIIRAAPYYVSDGDTGAVLSEFVNEWNTNLASVPRDIAHLMTERSTPGIGGVAYLGVVCSSYGYGLSHDSELIVAHEIGHNWSAGHCLDPWTRNILCNGGGLFIGPRTRDTITAHRLSRTCLEPVPLQATPLPPYAATDELDLRAPDLAAGSPLSVDVLANDHDANCELLAIFSHDTVSARGGAVALTSASGPGGRDELEYTPPAEAFIGLDSFSYTIVDASGATAGTDVVLDVSSPGVKAYWALDETSGTTAADSSGFGHDAVAQAQAQWVPGVFGGALEFDGTSQVLDTSASSFDPPWSLSTWVRRSVGAGSNARLIESSNGSLRLEQWYQTGRIGVTRYGVVDSHFGVSAPFDVWTHLTFVGTAVGTSLFVDGQPIGAVSTTIQAPMGPISDVDGPLAATLDDLRVYDVALEPGAIQGLFQFGGGAVAPRPVDGGSLADTGAEPLRWSAGFGVTSFDVYLGTDGGAVAAATTASPEYRGNQVAHEYVPTGLASGLTYHWRIDALVPSGAVTGPVWQFCLAPEGLLAHWRMDEGAGGITIDAAGLNDALLVGETTWVAGQAGAGLLFDGNDGLAASSLADFEPPWTVSMWVKREPSIGASAALMRSSDGALKLDQWPNTNKVGVTVWGVVDATFDVEAPLGTWMHLAFVGTAAGVDLYSDGVHADSVPVTLRAPTGPIGGLGDPLSAVVDDVRVYDRALSAAEILDLAQ